ncbi:MAG: hypothetical protein AB1650_01315 [Candidatus Omnitrophota bacterium]
MMEIERLLDQQERSKAGNLNLTGDLIRQRLVEYCKMFKTSWVNLGQSLYPVWKDKLFYAWGFEKFEYYLQEELGLKKETAMKMLKSYFFVEQNEPAYLSESFVKERNAQKVPGCEEVNVLRLARGKKELNKDDYRKLRQEVFEGGKDASVVRKDLTNLIRQRKQVDPEEERALRAEQAVKKLSTALRNFHNDMEILKLLPVDLIDDAKELLERLEKEVI